jgi:hypothetical protein
MASLVSTLQVIHILAAILMAWPFYALVAVNERGRLGPPLGDRLDIYLENVVRGRVIPCFIFQATVMGTGLALIFLHGLGFGGLLVNPALGAKFSLLIVIAALLGYVHARVQPRIDELFANSPGTPVPSEIADAINRLRLRRKRLASICLFSVLTMAMLGVQSWRPFPVWLTLALLAALALLTFRAYRSTMPYGWA